jgi:hypothetical protein
MTTTLLDAVARLQTALDTLAHALTAGDERAVLAAEEPLATAVTSLAAFRRTNADPTSGLPEAIASVRASVSRCQTLGGSASQFSRAVLGDASYSARGLQLVNAAPRRVTSIT